MSINFRKNTIIDSLTGGTHQWSTGTGSLGIWSVNGSAAESQRLYDTDPFGNEGIVWQTNPDVVSGPDGGWNTSYMTLDKTKLYRFSVWGKRSSVTTSVARMYFGCTGSSDVLNMSNGATNNNPYWGYPLLTGMTYNLWYLFVGHVFPVDYRVDGYQDSQHPNTGMWTIAGGRIGDHLPAGGNVGGDVKFSATTSSIRHRTYMFYSTSTAAHLQFFDPRIELCDGSEGTVEDLLAGVASESGNLLSSTSITNEGASFKHQKVAATGGDWIEDFGEWRSHVFTGSSSFVVNSYVGSSLPVDYLLVAGGGGGGARMGGGGGGGGVLTGYTYLTGNTYSITVGAGGAGATGTSPYDGSNGGNSTFNGLTAIGGGGGGGGANSDGFSDGKDGGSGGGGSGYAAGAPGSTGAGGTGTAGQGYDGGDQGAAYYAASGGGAGSVGGTSTSGGNPATGGTGTYSYILGRPHLWAGGGGPSGYSDIAGPGGAGGAGGGADATPGDFGTSGKGSILWGEDGNTGTNAAGGAGAPWTGGGGGGGVYSAGPGGDGGSGIVIIRYKYK